MLSFVGLLCTKGRKFPTRVRCDVAGMAFALPELNRSVSDEQADKPGNELFVPVLNGTTNFVTKKEAAQQPTRAPIFLRRSQVDSVIAASDPLVAKLGDLRGDRYFAIDVRDPSDFKEALAESDRVSRLPLVAPDMETDALGVLAYARGLMYFHQNTRYCSKCGTQLRANHDGKGRSCDPCKRTIYPRVDPAIITLVTRSDQCLLGRKASWPTGRYSTLAGFAEVGETLEDALVREVKEESGIDVDRKSIRYHSSQPWPFPQSLMVGFTAEAASTAVTADQEELEDARWFDKEFVRRKVESGGDEEFNIPSSYALANWLIRDWLSS